MTSWSACVWEKAAWWRATLEINWPLARQIWHPVYTCGHAHTHTHGFPFVLNSETLWVDQCVPAGVYIQLYRQTGTEAGRETVSMAGFIFRGSNPWGKVKYLTEIRTHKVHRSPGTSEPILTWIVLYLRWNTETESRQHSFVLQRSMAASNITMHSDYNRFGIGLDWDKGYKISNL